MPPAPSRQMPDALKSDALQLIIESLPMGTIVVDQAGQIVMLNRQIEEWFGYHRNEILGRLVECLIPERFLPHHPQYRDEYFAAPRVRPMGVNKNLYARRKDGSEFPCDVSLHPLPLSNGLHVMVHMQDANPRYESEARQRHEESLRRMHFMVEYLPAGAAYVSFDTGTLMVNQMFEEITGYTQAELADLPRAFELLFRGRSAEVQQQHAEDQAAGFPIPRVLLVERPDDKQAWVEMAAYRYDDHEVWLWHDITDRLAAQTRLVQSERLAAIGEMMTGLAHESRNALQRAQAALDMLELDLDQRPDLRTFSRRAVSAIDELQRLYEEVRNYAAPIQLERCQTDIEALCQEAWDQVQQVHPDKQIAFTTHLDEDARHLPIDSHRVKQVFRNILENAIAALPAQGGTIEVTAESLMDDGKLWVGIAIQDNGPGMNAEQQRRVFEPFFTTKTHGTGLGLAIVRRIMEAHGGTACVGSPERGARIILRFPKSSHS